MIPSTVIFFVWSFCLLNTLSPLTVALEETGDENTFTLLFSTLKPALLKQKSSMCLPGRISKTVFNGGAKTLLWQLRHVGHTHSHTQHAHARTQTVKQVHKEALQVSDARMSPYISTFQTCAAHVCRNLLADAEAQVSVVRKSWSKPSNAGSAELQHVANKSQNSFFLEQLLFWDKGMSQVRWSCFFFSFFIAAVPFSTLTAGMRKVRPGARVREWHRACEIGAFDESGWLGKPRHDPSGL